MPTEARVFVVEDDPVALELIEAQLRHYHHQIVLVATKKQQAIDMVRRLLELKVSVAILDNTLDEGSDDGREVLEAIEKYAPGVLTVGFSGRKFEGVTINLGKENISKLGKTVTIL